MKSDVEHYVEEIILYRNQLIEVEKKMNRHQNEIPTQVWQEFSEVSHQLEKAEEKARLFSKLMLGDINYVREKIISALRQFHEWRDKLREIENLFMEHIIRPGYRLKQTIQQREFLEQEYSRIQKSILNGEYKNQLDLKSDIRRILSQSDTTFEVIEEGKEEELNIEESLINLYFETDAGDVVEAISKEELIRDFKKIVLPKIHPDTSTTSDKDFKTIFEVYQQGDFLLMEAYITEYRGEVQPEPELETLDQLTNLDKTEKQYQRLLGKLIRRIERLKQSFSEHDIDDPDKILKNMENQHQSLLSKILEEAEKILQCRSKIEGLVKFYQEYYP